MEMKKYSLNVWDDALKKVEKSKSNKILTKDTANKRLRPQPEIIENVLEELEDKIKHYFKLFMLEKEKRSSAEKNNCFLHEEIAKAYELLDKNKVYTMKLEEKINNIKDNQSSLIDTVRRIDLLYIQLDTLVQSFAGICTQTAIDASENSNNNNNVNYKLDTIKMLLDYIYPCRTLDPRINALYGLLYYQTIGLLKDDKYSCPPIPPIPPVVPSQTDGWLPPYNLKSDHMHHDPLFEEKKFSDMVKKYKYGDGNMGYTKSGDSEKFKSENNIKKFKVSIIPQDLLGFDIKIGVVEFINQMKNPKIICVVRYNYESIYTVIQNNKRVTKPTNPDQVTNNEKYIFNVDNTIHLNTLPEKKIGDVPSFRIDVHDVRGKALLGTSRCSFISKKTLIKNSPWNIYSESSKGNVSIIGRMHVSVYPYPSKSLLPAEVFRNTTNIQYSDSINTSKCVENLQKYVNNSANLESKENLAINKSNTLGMYSAEKSQGKKSGPQIIKPPIQTIKIINTNKPNLRSSKISFKPYISKKSAIVSKIENIKDIKNSNIETMETNNFKNVNKIVASDISADIKATTNVNSTNIKKSESFIEEKNTNKQSNIKNLIKNLSKKIELHKPTNVPLTLKDLIKAKNNKEVNAQKEYEIQRNKSNEVNKFTLENAKLVKNVEIMENGKIKVKLPFYQNKKAPIKFSSMEQKNIVESQSESNTEKKVEDKVENKVEDKVENKVSESENAKKGLINQNNVAKIKVNPILKIKVEPQKPILNKLLNKIAEKSQFSKKQESNESEINYNSKNIPTKELENKSTIHNIDMKTSKFISKSSENAKEPRIKSLNLISKSSIEVKEKSTFVKKIPILKFKPHQIEEDNKNETNVKNVKISQIMKKPILKKDSSLLQMNDNSLTLKNILNLDNKRSVFIDKNKIKIKLQNKIKPIREIKKFVPKFNNI